MRERGRLPKTVLGVPATLVPARRRLLATLLVLAAPVGFPDAGRAADQASVWCGTATTPVDRKPELAAGRQVHVVYAVPLGGAPAVGVVDKIVGDVIGIDAWWRREDPTRAPRFDLFAFPSCPHGFGQLDISYVQLPNTHPYYEANQLRIDQDLQAAGFSDEYKKYMVFYEAPDSANFTQCGKGNDPFPAIYLYPRCREADLGTGLYPGFAIAHELIHALGGVPTSAPHICSVYGSVGHSCDDARDMMHPTQWKPLADAIFDVNRDDYYGHSGTWLDVQDSSWLMRLDGPQFTLTVGIRGDGGQVRSVAPGVDCPGACAAVWDGGTQVTLAASPPAGKRLLRWQGACAGASATCTVAMDGDRTTEAVFGLPPTAGVEALAPAYRVGEPVSFRSASTDGDGTIVVSAWSFGDGTSATGDTTTHAYSAPGTFTATLSVTDDDGVTSTALALVRVIARAPIASIAPLEPRYDVATRVALSSSSSAPDGSVTASSWEFGDGARASGASVFHRYARPGVYTVTLTVTSDTGETAHVSTQVTVADIVAPSVKASPASGRAGTRIRLPLRASDQHALARGRIVVYRGARRLATFDVALSGTTASRSSAWRAPSRPGLLRWCIRVTDAAGNVSSQSCARLRLRARR